MGAQRLIDLGYAGYAGWGDAEAEADFAATGGAGKGGSSGFNGGGIDVDTILDNAIKAMEDLFPKPVQPYEEVNPFFFDEALAEEASTAEYSPYYEELLSDYVATVEKTKSRSQEDLDTTLEQLSGGREYYLGKERRLLDRSLRSTNEGYAGQGLFFSGAREKERRELEQEYGADIGEYERKYEYNVGQAEKTTGRTIEDVERGQSLYTRDIEREKEAAIKSGILARKGEAREEYEMSRQKYYQSKNPYYYG